MKFILPFLFLLLAVFSGCHQQENQQASVPVKDAVDLFLPVKFQFINKTFFSFDKPGDKKTAVVNAKPDTLTSQQKNDWNYEIPYFEDLARLFYGATFYSRQNKVGNISPIVINARSDDYNVYSLLCISPEGKLISHMDLAEESMGPTDSTYSATDDSIITISYAGFSVFENDSVFDITNVSYIDNIQGSKTYTIDSVVNIYKIESTGKILLQKKDSVRVLKKEIYDYK